MPILSTDIEYRLSGGAGNTDPNASLGGAMSTAGGGEITSAVLNNLFDDVSGDEASAGDTEYRGIYVKNAHGSLTWSSIKAWIQTASASADTSFEIAIADEAKNTAIETIANESTAPTGPTFSAPSNKAGGITLPDLAAGDYIGIWIKRIVSSSAAAVASDGPTIRVEGDTPA